MARIKRSDNCSTMRPSAATAFRPFNINDMEQGLAIMEAAAAKRTRR